MNRSPRLTLDVARATLGVSLLTAIAAAHVTTRVSVSSAGVQSNQYSIQPSISASGLLVAFTSNASNLVRGDTNGKTDIFVHDRSTGSTVRVSKSSQGVEANGDSELPSISADGRFVAFDSTASNLVGHDTNNAIDVFVFDRWNGIVERVSVDSAGTPGDFDSSYPSISADGRVVAFVSWAANLVPNDTNGIQDVFIHDRVSGITERVNIDSSGVQANGESARPSISADGQIVAFGSQATNLVRKDSNASCDIFVHDRSMGITERVSVDPSGAQSNNWSDWPSISADGRMVAFYSAASNLIPNDPNSQLDIFVHDRSTRVTECVSVNSSGASADGWSFWSSISADGNSVAFESWATNLAPNDTNHTYDIFVHDRSTGVTRRASVDSSGVPASWDCMRPSLSANGRVVAFEGYTNNLVPNDTNQMVDIFVHETYPND